MASLVVLGAIYLKDMDSIQGMKNPVAVQSTQARRKENLAPWQFRKGCVFAAYEISLPCESFLPMLNVPAAFDILTFLSLFGFLPNLSPCIIVCFGYFGNL